MKTSAGSTGKEDSFCHSLASVLRSVHTIPPGGPSLPGDINGPSGRTTVGQQHAGMIAERLSRASDRRNANRRPLHLVSTERHRPGSCPRRSDIPTHCCSARHPYAVRSIHDEYRVSLLPGKSRAESAKVEPFDHGAVRDGQICTMVRRKSARQMSSLRMLDNSPAGRRNSRHFQQHSVRPDSPSTWHFPCFVTRHR
jgi:hypothetical protein